MKYLFSTPPNLILKKYTYESKELIQYLFFGGIGAISDFAIFLILVQESNNLIFSNIISTCCGITVSFVLNARFNFKKGFNFTALARFFTIGFAGLLLSSLYLKWLINGIGISPSVAKASALPLIALLQYLCNRYWTFRDT